MHDKLTNVSHNLLYRQWSPVTSCFTPGLLMLLRNINMLFTTVRNAETMVTRTAIYGILLKIQVMYFTQENAADLHGVGVVPRQSRRRSRGEILRTIS